MPLKDINIIPIAEELGSLSLHVLSKHICWGEIDKIDKIDENIFTFKISIIFSLEKKEERRERKRIFETNVLGGKVERR